jgi:hypothetical protein
MKRWPLVLALGLAACAAPAPRLISLPTLPPPPAPPAGLARILGSGAPAVIALLGPASLDRSEGPARQLQFIRPPCILDVFLYSGAGSTQTVRTATARKADGSRIDPGACLALVIPAGR